MLIGLHSWWGPRNYRNEIWKPSRSIGVILDLNVISKASMSSQVWCQQTCHPNFNTSVVPPWSSDFLKIESSVISEMRKLFIYSHIIESSVRSKNYSPILLMNKYSSCHYYYCYCYAKETRDGPRISSWGGPEISEIFFFKYASI